MVCNCCKFTLSALRIYWQSLFVMIYPLALIPVFVCNNISEMRCLYVVLVMTGYWVFEVLPLAVTSLIPLVLFPLMGVMDADKVSLCYMKDTNMMFIGGLIIAIAVEHCNLHTRVALYVIKCVGCGPRRLNLGLFVVTMFVSMWMSNTAATAMMIPIVQATLEELEGQGIGSMYENNDLDNPNAEDKTEGNVEQKERRPTKTTMCYYISTAYAAAIGGCGTIIGTGTNLTFKGLFETIFPERPEVDFAKWMFMWVPVMLAMMLVSIIWMQFLFMGLFRPNSADAKKIKVGQEGVAVAKKLITKKIEEMGPMSFHETSVAIFFMLCILLWLFRKPEVFPGWPEFITQHKVTDATAALVICLFLFAFPSKPDFFYICSNDETKRPKEPSPPLISWKVVQNKMHWGLVFLLGAGFALAEASKVSGMSSMIAHHLREVASLPRIYVMIIASLMTTVITQFFSSNVAVANLILPVLAEMATVAKMHPMYLMLPATTCCSFAFCLPVSTPPNALVAAACNLKSSEMIKAGLGMIVLCVAVVLAIFPFYGPLIYDLEDFPSRAENETSR